MDTIQFRVTEDHLNLMRRFTVGWCDDEYGAPEIDPKRPYGNSDVYSDLYEIVHGEEWDPDEHGEMDDRTQDQLEQWHKETETALQIALHTGEFKTGLYEADKYSRDWRWVSP